MLDQPVPNPLAKNPNLHTHKVFAAVGLVLIGVIVILFGAAIIFKANLSDLFNNPTTTDNQGSTSSAKPDPTANWKTLTTADFSIGYPASWKEPTFDQLSTSYTYLFSSNMEIQVGFHFDQNLQRAKTYQEELTSESQYAINKKSITVNGQTETEFLEKTSTAHNGGMIILKDKGSDIIWISMPFYKDSDQQLFDQILSTFKFTDNTSNWKTISFNFPGDISYPESYTVTQNTALAKGLMPETNYTILVKNDKTTITFQDVTFDGGLTGTTEGFSFQNNAKTAEIEGSITKSNGNLGEGIGSVTLTGRPPALHFGFTFGSGLTETQKESDWAEIQEILKTIVINAD